MTGVPSPECASERVDGMVEVCQVAGGRRTEMPRGRQAGKELRSFRGLGRQGGQCLLVKADDPAQVFYTAISFESELDGRRERAQVSR